MTIDPISLPEKLAVSIRLAHEFATDIATAGSGFEHRNARYGASRRHYVLDTGPRPVSEIQELLVFFEARRGRHQGFLLRDFMDFHSGFGDTPQADDQKLQVPNALAGQGILRLVKRYGDNGPVRRIFKPQREGFMLAEAGRALREGRDFVLHTDSGYVQLLAHNSHVPSLTAGFYFSVPVRFDADRVEVTRLDGNMAQIAPLPLVELKIPETPPARLQG